MTAEDWRKKKKFTEEEEAKALAAAIVSANVLLAAEELLGKAEAQKISDAARKEAVKVFLKAFDASAEALGAPSANTMRMRQILEEADLYDPDSETQ